MNDTSLHRWWSALSAFCLNLLSLRSRPVFTRMSLCLAMENGQYGGKSNHWNLQLNSYHTQQCRSEKKENIPSLVLCELKKYHPSPGNVKFNYLSIFQSLKLRIWLEIKILPLSLKLNFTPNTLACYGLSTEAGNIYSISLGKEKSHSRV